MWPLNYDIFDFFSDFSGLFCHPRGPIAKDFPELYCIPRIPAANNDLCLFDSKTIRQSQNVTTYYMSTGCYLI